MQPDNLNETTFKRPQFMQYHLIEESWDFLNGDSDSKILRLIPTLPTPPNRRPLTHLNLFQAELMVNRWNKKWRPCMEHLCPGVPQQEV
jgi:hypothetical protein